jgi:hypothetical protein
MSDNKYVEFNIERGSNFSDTITITSEVTNQPVDITGYEVSGWLKKSPISQSPSGNLTCVIEDTANGVISISMTGANTANLSADKYFFDVKTVDTRSGNAVAKLIKGVFFVDFSITD